VAFDYTTTGNEDILMTQNDRPAVLMRNPGASPPAHWVTLTLQGASRIAMRLERSSPRSGWRRAAALRQTASPTCHKGKASAFGLGGGTVDRVRVRWPGRFGFWEEWIGWRRSVRGPAPGRGAACQPRRGSFR